MAPRELEQKARGRPSWRAGGASYIRGCLHEGLPAAASPPLLWAGIMELPLLCVLVVLAGEWGQDPQLEREGGTQVGPITSFSQTELLL